MKNHIGLRLLQRISGVRKSRHRCQTHRSPYLGIQELEDRRMFVVGPFGDAPIMATGSGFDGVVQIASNLFSGTASGVLLSDGLHVLTAAHVVDHDNGDIGDGHVDHGVFQIKTDFLTADGSVRTIVQQISSDNIFLPSSWDGNHEHGSDIAVFRLPAVAPATAERYDIYRGDGEHGRIFDLVGFGLTGNGTDGVREDSGGQRRFGQNIFDVNTATDRLGFDFDDVTPLGYRPEDLGLPGFESMVAQGDSGGPDFIDGKIAGINSYLRPDRFAKFGAIGIATRVARFTGFVDGVGATLHDVTLNMGLQPMGQDGMDDRIDVEQVDGTLNIAVNGMPVFSDRINHISRVRIIGSSDRDSVILNESVTVPVFINGGPAVEVPPAGQGVCSPNDQFSCDDPIGDTTRKLAADQVVVKIPTGFAPVTLASQRIQTPSTFVELSNITTASVEPANGNGGVATLHYRYNDHAVTSGITSSITGNPGHALTVTSDKIDVVHVHFRDSSVGDLTLDGTGKTALILDDSDNRDIIIENLPKDPELWGGVDDNFFSKPKFTVSASSVEYVSENAWRNPYTNDLVESHDAYTHIHYSGLGSIKVIAGASDTVFDVISTSSLTPVIVCAGSSQDSVSVAGSIHARLSYKAIDGAVQTWGLPGDHNGNGFVDAADYTIWKDAFGSTTQLAADANDNGVVDAADYTIWRDLFGQAASAMRRRSANWI